MRFWVRSLGALFGRALWVRSSHCSVQPFFVFFCNWNELNWNWNELNWSEIEMNWNWNEPTWNWNELNWNWTELNYFCLPLLWTFGRPGKYLLSLCSPRVCVCVSARCKFRQGFWVVTNKQYFWLVKDSRVLKHKCCLCCLSCGFFLFRKKAAAQTTKTSLLYFQFLKKKSKSVRAVFPKHVLVLYKKTNKSEKLLSLHT